MNLSLGTLSEFITSSGVSPCRSVDKIQFIYQDIYFIRIFTKNIYHLLKDLYEVFHVVTLLFV